MNLIWKQFVEYISNSIGNETAYISDYQKIKNSILANLLFNNLNKISFKKNDNQLEQKENLTIYFGGVTYHSLYKQLEGYKKIVVNKGNIVTIKGKPQNEKTVYLIELPYNNRTAYIPHLGIIITTLNIGDFLLSEEVILTHLINQTRDDLVITKETLKYVETHETTKMLSRIILESKLTKQAEDGLKSKRTKLLKDIVNKNAMIEKAKLEIAGLHQEISEIEENIIYLKGGEELANELFDLTEKLDQIEYMLVQSKPTSTIIDIHTNQIKLTKYDKDRLNRFLENNGWSSNPRFRAHLKSFINGEVDILFSKYLISITIYSSGEMSYTLGPKVPQNANPHESIGCLGSYRSYVEKFTKEKKLVQLIMILLEFLGSITFGDGGASSLPERAIIKSKEGAHLYG